MKYGAENWRRGEVTWSVEKGIWLSREQPEALCESLRKKRKKGLLRGRGVEQDRKQRGLKLFEPVGPPRTRILP